MAWIEELRDHLRSLEQPARVWRSLPEGFDMAGRRALLWQEIDAAQLPNDEVHKGWLKKGALESFVLPFILDLYEMAPTIDRATAERLVDAAIVRNVSGHHMRDLRRAETIVVEELASLHAPTWTPFDEVRKPTGPIETYAVEIGLAGDLSRLQPLGEAFLGLAGVDAVRFLLEAEVAQSIGLPDEWRISRAGLEIVGRSWVDFDHPPKDTIGPCWRSADRMVRLGIADRVGGIEDVVERIKLSDDGRSVVAPVLDSTANPIRVLIETLLAERKGRMVQRQIGGPAPASGGVSYARMVAHEIKNAIVPAMTAVDRLFEDLSQPSPPGAAQLVEHRDRIHKRMQRVYQFAVESETLAQAAEPGNVDLRLAVQDAAEATEGDRNGRVKLSLTLDSVRVPGSRYRWGRAIGNLVRNASQAIRGTREAGPGEGVGEIEVSGLVALDRLHLFVDDSGPGVAEEHRQRIFRPGYSLRGSSGLGLADVHEIVGQAGGRITCEESPLGGARFHIELPVVT